MAHIVILGSSVTGQSVAFHIREQNQHARITLVSEEEYPLYDRRLLGDFLAGRVNEEDLFLCSFEYYKQKHIEFLDRRLPSGVNAQKKSVVFRKGSGLTYDLLIIAQETKPYLPDIPGARKPGVTVFGGLSEARQARSRIINEPVCIVGGDESSLRAACAIAKRFKQEVKLISRRPIKSFILPAAVEVIESGIQEIIGDGQVQAVRLSGGKVIGVGSVLFMESKADTDFLNGTGIATKDGFILVDEEGRTAVDGVYACGMNVRVTGKETEEKSWNDCVQEGRQLASCVVREMENICQKS